MRCDDRSDRRAASQVITADKVLQGNTAVASNLAKERTRGSRGSVALVRVDFKHNAFVDHRAMQFVVLVPRIRRCKQTPGLV